jgi:Flp pilus assembly protein TadB
LVLGLLAALNNLLPFLGEWARKMPAATVAVAGAIGVVGAALQLSQPSEEERARIKVEKQAARKRELEEIRMQKRWGKHG